MSCFSLPYHRGRQWAVKAPSPAPDIPDVCKYPNDAMLWLGVALTGISLLGGAKPLLVPFSCWPRAAKLARLSMCALGGKNPVSCCAENPPFLPLPKGAMPAPHRTTVSLILHALERKWPWTSPAFPCLPLLSFCPPDMRAAGLSFLH